MDTLGGANANHRMAKARAEAPAFATQLMVALANAKNGEWPRGANFEKTLKDSAAALMVLSGPHK